MTNTAENLIVDRFSDEELEKADLGRLRMLAKELREQRDENDRARASNAAVITDYRRQQEKLADALMVILGDPMDALIESKIEYSSRSLIEDLVDTAMQDFDIDEHRCASDDMIDERLSERLGEPESEEDRQAAVEEIVKDVISGASISIDI